MPYNTFGNNFSLTHFGESHGPAVGGVVDGCPAGLALDMEWLTHDLDRRRPQRPCESARREPDKVQWLSGIYQGRTLGSPIAFLIQNCDAHSDDYATEHALFRPGHADYTYQCRFGHRDPRGGGRASARETVVRVVAGNIAKQLLATRNISINASSASFQPELPSPQPDTYGGKVLCTISGLNAGIGSPLFGKLNALLAYGCMTIPSAIGFEMGDGIAAANLPGSQWLDRWAPSSSPSENHPLQTITNHCGGVQGGISNGMPVTFSVTFHPIVSIPQPTHWASPDGSLSEVTPHGRHDLCQIHRAAVIVEAMAALVLADLILS